METDVLTVCRALDLGVAERDRINNVVVTTANRANRQAMPTRADAVLERNILKTSQRRSRKAIGANRSAIGKHTVPELMATQSSWLATLAPLMTTLELEPISKPSVL